MDSFCFVNFGGSRAKPCWYMDLGNVWMNMNGGYCHKNKKDVILISEQADDFCALDWKGSYLDNPEEDGGWLSPEGRFYGCNYRDHDLAAELVIKREVGELEKEGWVRIFSKDDYLMKSGKRMTAEQRNWMLQYYYQLDEDDLL